MRNISFAAQSSVPSALTKRVMSFSETIFKTEQNSLYTGQRAMCHAIHNIMENIFRGCKLAEIEIEQKNER